MKLAELIKVLESLDPDSVFSSGLMNPHPYRGNYADLAFEPGPRSTVGEQLRLCRLTVGRTLMGYKGGEVKMTADVDVYSAFYGSEGRSIVCVVTTHSLVAGRVVSEHSYSLDYDP